MKKTLLIGIALAISATTYAQKVEYRQAQTRVIEPMQDVYIRPLVADLEIIKDKRQKYMPSSQFLSRKLTDLTMADIEDAKILATYQAAVQEDADIIVGATYEVRNHIDEKGKPSEYGIDIIVSGYPAKYTNWHKMGENPSDEKWVGHLIDGQNSRRLGDSDRKTEAIKGERAR